MGQTDETGHPGLVARGIICTGETYKNAVKVTFAKGAFLKDQARLFNSSLEGNLRRAIDIREGEHIDASAFKALVRRAIALNSDSSTESHRCNACTPRDSHIRDDHDARLIGSRVVFPNNAGFPEAPHVRNLLRQVRLNRLHPYAGFEAIKRDDFHNVSAAGPRGNFGW